MKKMITFTSIGDCVIDRYVEQNQFFLGGTAFNVAVHATKYGARTTILSAVGKDQAGAFFIDTCKKLHIHTNYLATCAGKTSEIVIQLDANKSPIFSGWDLGVLKQFRLTQKQAEFLKTQNIARAVFFTPLITLFNDFANMVLPHTLKAGDFAGSSIYSPKVTEIEHFIPQLDIIFKSLKVGDISEQRYLQGLSRKYKKLIVVLLGKAGSMVFENGVAYTATSLKHSTAIDTTGAGDAYSTDFLLSWYETKNSVLAMEKATQKATEVIKNFGSTSYYTKKI